jgi:ornithine cyclodeaminase
MKIYQRAQIEAAIRPIEVIAAVESGFVSYSKGEVTVPPVGHLEFERPRGDVHIKYGYRHGDTVFVIKVASSFYENPKIGLSSSSGLMMVFSALTGAPEVALLDEGFLTDFRTAAAGAVAAKYLAPSSVGAIGILGSGIQARFQLDLLRHVTACRQVFVWARDREKARALAVPGFTVTSVGSAAEVAAHCNLIVTTTPSREPLLQAADIRPGTHITAVGADGFGKQELPAELFGRAAVLAVDSRAQCLDHGDSSYAFRAGLVPKERFVELGELIVDRKLARTHDDQITIADLTGLAVQDIQIAKLACERLASSAS